MRLMLSKLGTRRLNMESNKFKIHEPSSMICDQDSLDKFEKCFGRLPSFNESCLIRDYGVALVIIFMNRLKPSFNA
jgi:hypothetical protein